MSKETGALAGIQRQIMWNRLIAVVLLDLWNEGKVPEVGALSVLPWFGKPTYALFTVVQVLAILGDDGLVVPRRKALRAFALGGALASLLPLGWLLARGDIIAISLSCPNASSICC